MVLVSLSNVMTAPFIVTDAIMILLVIPIMMSSTVHLIQMLRLVYSGCSASTCYVVSLACSLLSFNFYCYLLVTTSYNDDVEAGTFDPNDAAIYDYDYAEFCGYCEDHGYALPMLDTHDDASNNSSQHNMHVVRRDHNYRRSHLLPKVHETSNTRRLYLVPSTAVQQPDSSRRGGCYRYSTADDLQHLGFTTQHPRGYPSIEAVGMRSRHSTYTRFGVRFMGPPMGVPIFEYR